MSNSDMNSFPPDHSYINEVLLLIANTSVPLIPSLVSVAGLKAFFFFWCTAALIDELDQQTHTFPLTTYK